MNADDNVVTNSEIVAKPLVSVLVPSYNHEKYVIECLESIKNLCYPRLELILSDDKSSDTTYDLAGQWIKQNDSRFERAIAIRQPKNLGIVQNLQYLFDGARGEYLAYIASDDEFLPSSMEDRIATLQANQDIDAVFGNAQLISSSGTVLRERFIPRRIARELRFRSLLIKSLLVNWQVPGPVMMLRRKAVSAGGSIGTLPLDLKGEDKYIYIRLASLCKLMFVDAIVAKYRMVENSASRAHALRRTVAYYNIQSDTKNKHLLGGVNRCIIDLTIAAFDLELNKGQKPFYILKKILFRCASIGLKVMLFVAALVYRAMDLRYRARLSRKGAPPLAGA